MQFYIVTKSGVIRTVSGYLLYKGAVLTNRRDITQGSSDFPDVMFDILSPLEKGSVTEPILPYTEYRHIRPAHWFERVWWGFKTK